MTITRRFYNFSKWLLILVAVFFVFFLLAFVSYALFDKKYENKFFPGTFIAGTDVSGMTLDEVEDLLVEKIDLIKEKGVVFAYHNEQATLDVLYTSAEADIAYPVVMFETDQALDFAYNYARSGSWLFNLVERVGLFKKSKDFNIEVTAKREEIENFLTFNFSRFSTPAKDAKLVYEKLDKRGGLEFSVEEEVYGQALDMDKAIEELHKNLARLENSPIILEASVEYPKVYKKDAFNVDAKAKDILELSPISLVYQDKSWEINEDELLDLLELKSMKDESDKDQVYVSISRELTEEYLGKLKEDINVEAMDAKFEISDGKVERFQRNQDGLKLDVGSSFELLEEALLLEASTTVALLVETVKSKDSTKEMNDLGIVEILGTGHSSFAGSPSNRRHNIEVGAASVNGTLLEPGEEFSLLGVLGDIDKEAGYLPELVIKDNKTVPEYGGGLCQIGTTVFRATVESGLPVTMRRNHSYRVSYYEPAGTDATIYDPWPDYRFQNDTEKNILIQSRIEGDDLYFDFWGTPDGRIASSTYPVIYNIKKPGPTKMIETLDLEPGVKKCTETAHNGADAYFDYSIEYPDGELVEERFKSHYVPWQAVCLIGVEELPGEKNEQASSTDSIKN